MRPIATVGMAWSVCDLSDGHVCEPSKNGWTDWVGVWGANSRGPKEPCIRGSCTLPPPGECDWSICVTVAMRPVAAIMIATCRHRLLSLARSNCVDNINSPNAHFIILNNYSWQVTDGNYRRWECQWVLWLKNRFVCFRYLNVPCGDSVDNTVGENSSVFSLIRMRWLPSARACWQ